MYVCSCNVLTDHDVRAVATEAPSVGAVYRCLGCRPQCGLCARTIRAVLTQAREEAGCGCPDICAPDTIDCPAVERVAAITRRIEVSIDEDEIVLDATDAGIVLTHTHRHADIVLAEDRS